MYSEGWQQAHSKLRYCCNLAEDGQKDQQDWMIIFFHLPNIESFHPPALAVIPSLSHCHHKHQNYFEPAFENKD